MFNAKLWVPNVSNRNIQHRNIENCDEKKKGTSKEYTEWKITCKKKKRRLELIKNCEKILRVKSIENNIVQWRPPKSRNLWKDTNSVDKNVWEKLIKTSKIDALASTTHQNNKISSKVLDVIKTSKRKTLKY